MAPELVALLAVAAVAVVLVLAGGLAFAGWHARGVAAEAREQLLAGELARARAERDAEREATTARAAGRREDHARAVDLGRAAVLGDLDGVLRQFPEPVADPPAGEPGATPVEG